MKRISSVVCWVLVCQFLLASCSNPDDKPPINIEKSYVNQQIALGAPGGLFNTFNATDPIYLEIQLSSKNEIVFPNNYNLKIFERKAGDWIEIFEKPTTRLPAGDVVLSTNAKFKETTFVTPVLTDYTRRYQLRIYVIGEMKTDEGIKQVAAYIDLELHP